MIWRGWCRVSACSEGSLIGPPDFPCSDDPSLIRSGDQFSSIGDRMTFNWWEEDQPKIEIFSLGSLRGTVDGHLLEAPEWGSPGALQLLTILLEAPNGISKEAAVERLFPLAPKEKINGAFHANLQRIRRVLGRETVVKLPNGTYAVSPAANIVWDLNELREAVHQIDSSPVQSREWLRGLGRAADLYDGPFAPEFSSDWAADVREHVAALWSGVEKVLRQFQTPDDADPTQAHPPAASLRTRRWDVPIDMPAPIRAAEARVRARAQLEEVGVALAAERHDPIIQSLVEELVLPAIKLAVDVLAQDFRSVTDWRDHRSALIQAGAYFLGAERVAKRHEGGALLETLAHIATIGSFLWHW